MTALHEIASRVGGTVHGDQIVTPLGRVYCGFTGAVRFEPRGLQVVTLGPWGDVDACVAAYWATVDAAVA